VRSPPHPRKPRTVAVRRMGTARACCVGLGLTLRVCKGKGFGGFGQKCAPENEDTRALKSSCGQLSLRSTADGQKRLWCRRWRRRAHAHARAAAHAHDARVPTRFSAEIARCAAAPWAPGLAEQRLSAGASGTGGERRQQVVELGLAERLAAPVLTPVYACCSPDGGL
jgi:hypothetical protein